MKNWLFGQNLQKKSLNQKKKKKKKEHHDRVLHVRKSLGGKFQLKRIISNFRTILTQKEYFQSKKEYNENHYRILQIQVSLGFKFRLQQTILIFLNKFTIKRYFRSKTGRVNITIEFFMFELEWETNFSLHWQF